MKGVHISSESYPGSDCSAGEIPDLAIAYCDAASALLADAKKGEPLSYAPARLCAIYATDLFPNAYLRHSGVSPESIRGSQHDLADKGACKSLKLKKKTAQHVIDMTERREYLISRYAPELTSHHTELNRLTATLKEIRTKVTAELR